MAVKPLNHYSLTTPGSIYDEEAMTALELAGRTAGKVNETVEAFNILENKTHEHLTAQDNEIAERTAKQDAAIPEKVKENVQEHIDNGEFDDQIEEHIGNLEARVDNLINSVTPGNTTRDVELLDIRTGVNTGETYASAGDAVRAKANTNAINRLLDGDIFKTHAVNLFPYLSRSSFDYDPAGGVAFRQIGDLFTLAAGDYMLIATELKSKKLFISDINDVRVYDVPATDINNFAHYFTIPASRDGETFKLYYGSTTGDTEAGTFSIGNVYIFPKDSVKIPNDILDREFSILNAVEVTHTKGKNLISNPDQSWNYDGVTFPMSMSISVDVEPGDYIIKFGDGVPPKIIITCEGGRVLDVDRAESETFYKFTVPEGSHHIDIYGYMASTVAPLAPAGTYYLRNIVMMEDNPHPFLPDYLTRYNEIVDLIDQRTSVTKSGGKFLTASGFMSAGGMIEIPEETHVKKNYSITFNGTFNSMSGLRIGQGKTSYNGCYLEISPRYISLNYYLSSASQISIQEHGLTFTDFINVNINQVNELATITVTTGGGSFTLERVVWIGCNGKVFAESMGSGFMHCTLNWTSADIDKKVWMFGDSYFGMNSERLLGQLFKRGYSNYLASGFPGGGSANELTSLQTLLTLNTPDVIVWCLGMNNGDNGAINSSWLETVNTVKEICSERGITLILATIPNCPKVDNTYKNEWVRNSGYRYIDFNKAVVSSGATWYNGLLSTDEVHPTEIGASVLAGRMITDAPEIMR